MRVCLALGALTLAACHPAASSAPAPARCGPSVPSTAQHPISMRAQSLAGDYELIQVQTQPESGAVTSGDLHLMPLDSAARAGAVGGAVRDLVGWLDLVDGDSQWKSAVASRDPARPGVVVAGEHLRLGYSRQLEGVVQYLTITAVAADGFWGWWKSDRGTAVVTEPGTNRILPDPAGYFCALRRDASR